MEIDDELKKEISTGVLERRRKPKKAVNSVDSNEASIGFLRSIREGKLEQISFSSLHEESSSSSSSSSSHVFQTSSSMISSSSSTLGSPLIEQEGDFSPRPWIGEGNSFLTEEVIEEEEVKNNFDKILRFLRN